MNYIDDYRKDLKEYIKQAEQSYIWYGDEITRFYKERHTFNPPADWIQFLKEMKNNMKKYLKDMIEEMQYLNEGLNPPHCYQH